MTSAELATWRSLLDTTAELRRVLGAELQETSLSPADYHVLLALTEAHGRRMRSSELARTIDWERSRLSHHLGRMERRGLIRRYDCATDSRGAEISLTAEGARFTDGGAGRFDEIILATGFGAALGPLGGLVQIDAKGFARRRDRVVSVDQPGLYVVGHNYDATGGLYNISRDARLAARLIATESKTR